MSLSKQDREDIRRETLREVLLRLCPGCNPLHALDNGRVWGFCGGGRLFRDVRTGHEDGAAETEVLAIIRALPSKASP